MLALARATLSTEAIQVVLAATSKRFVLLSIITAKRAFTAEWFVSRLRERARRAIVG
jgi:hypothetical protein